MNNVFNINWQTFIKQHLPVDWRKSKMVSFLYAFIAPLRSMYNEFLQFRTTSLYKLRHNSQICYLRAVLNDSFDMTLRRIQINQVALIMPVWFYEPEEDRPVYFYEEADNNPVYFREETDFSQDYDFIVSVPIALKPAVVSEQNTMLVKMRGLIDYYKIFVKNYNIIWV